VGKRSTSVGSAHYGKGCQGQNFGGRRYRIIDKKYTLEQSNVLCQRRILLSNSINPKRRLWWTGKNVGAENNLLNDLGFNLCVVPQSPVMRLVTYFGGIEVIKTEVLWGASEGVGVDKIRLGPVNVNLQTEEIHCNYSVLIGSPE